MTTGKTIALTVWTFVRKVMSLFLNMLSSFTKAYLSRSNHLLISWMQSLSTVILEPKKRKSVTASTFSPSICHDIMGPDAHPLFPELNRCYCILYILHIFTFCIFAQCHLPSTCFSPFGGDNFMIRKLPLVPCSLGAGP